MTQVHSFGSIYPIAHANITSGVWINKYDIPISHDEMVNCLQQMETVMGDDAPGLCDALAASNGYTLILTPTLVEDMQSTQSPWNHPESPGPISMARLAFIMDSGKTFLIEFSSEFTQRYQMSLRHQGPQGFVETVRFPPGEGHYQGQGHYQGPSPSGIVSQTPWLQQLGYLTGMLRFAGYNEAHGNVYKGFAK